MLILEALKTRYPGTESFSYTITKGKRQEKEREERGRKEAERKGERQKEEKETASKYKKLQNKN